MSYEDLDPTTPVVVGAAEIVHRDGPEFVPSSATALMLEAVRAALAPTGASDALGAATGAVFVPHGTWSESDPGRAIANSLGARARSIRSELGVLQHTLLQRAAVGVRDGEFDVAIVVGGENRWSGVVAAKGGGSVPDAPAEAHGEPDEVIAPSEPVITPIEIERNLTVAAHQYAIIESAIRHDLGRTVAEHQHALGELWGRAAAIAVDAPAAWDRRGMTPDDIAFESPSNRMIAAPYPKWLVSQWNVDQAAALVFTTVGTARRLGIDESQWVFPLAMVLSNLVVPMPERAELHRWPAAGVCARTAFAAAQVSADEVGPIDLYSCFPAAVQVQAREMGIDMDRDLTVTGGMVFGGGPFNNYSLQGAAAVVRRVREAPGTIGLSSAVSGLCTKPSVAIWSSASPRAPFVALDVAADADPLTERRPVSADAVGEGIVVGATVVPGRESVATVAVVEIDGVRTVVQNHDPVVGERFRSDDPVGLMVSVLAPGEFVLRS